jgi:hypothetical protein
MASFSIGHEQGHQQAGLLHCVVQLLHCVGPQTFPGRTVTRERSQGPPAGTALLTDKPRARNGHRRRSGPLYCPRRQHACICTYCGCFIYSCCVRRYTISYYTPILIFLHVRTCAQKVATYIHALGKGHCMMRHIYATKIMNH